MGGLGTDHEILFQNEDRGGKYESRFRSKWQLRRFAANIIHEVRYNHRMTDCHQKVEKGGNAVDVVVHSDKAWFRGQWQCGCVWVCPVCAPRIAEKRRKEMQQGVDYALKVGHGVTLVTLTQRHSSREPLMESMVRYAKSLKSLKSGREYAAFRKEFGILGEIRALEVTHGKNGWHVHTHSIVISNAPIEGEQIARMKDALFVLWFRAQAKHGAEKPSHAHGVDVRPAKYVADYIAKWGFAEELTKGYLKKGWDGGRTPWELLAAAHDGCNRSKALWLEFAEAFEDRRQLLWSPGLRQRLALKEEITDQEVLALEPDEGAMVAATVDLDTWTTIVRSNSYETVLTAALSSRDELFGLLNRLRTEVEMYGGPPPGPREDWQR